MTDATCRPVPTPLTVWEREHHGDRMTELLECLAECGPAAPARTPDLRTA
jgi:hypothetical protein